MNNNSRRSLFICLIVLLAWRILPAQQNDSPLSETAWNKANKNSLPSAEKEIASGTYHVYPSPLIDTPGYQAYIANLPPLKQENGIGVYPPQLYDERVMMQMLQGMESALSATVWNLSTVQQGLSAVQGLNEKLNSAGLSLQFSLNSHIAALAANTALPVSAYNLTPQTSVQQSAEDILAEQIELQTRLDMVRMLVNQAYSDQLYKPENGEKKLRRQAILGFNIGVDQKYPNAVAQVELTVTTLHIDKKDNLELEEPAAPNVEFLVPLEKTYNVSAVTDNVKGFNGVVSLAPAASLGGSSKNEKGSLYLVRDSDTIALPQMMMPADTSSDMTATAKPGIVSNYSELIFNCLQLFGVIPHTLTHNFAADQTNSVRFGWQFRPVLDRKIVDGVPAGFCGTFTPGSS